MTVESVTYISDLNASYPASGDAKSEGDDHIRNLKTGIKTTFPNISGAVTPTHTELNYVDGVTSAIQTQLDAKIPLAGHGVTSNSDLTLNTTHRRKYVIQNLSGTITVPANVFTTYDEVWIYNTVGSPITIAQGADLTLRLDATSTTGSRTLADKSMARVFFITATVASIDGSGVS